MTLLLNSMRENSKDNVVNMIKVLASQNKGLNIVHINAQSLRNKIDEFRYTFSKSNIDAICVSETWFLSELEDALFALSGYKLFRADRGRRGGGVAIYIKKNISCKLVSRSTADDCIEFLFLELLCNNKKLLIGAAYRPNCRTNYQVFMEKLEQIVLLYEDIVICGDFNDNVLKESLLIPEMQSFGLTLVNTTEPTHFSALSNSLIDLFFVSSKNKILLYDQLSAPMFSKHDLCFLTFDYKISPFICSYSYRDFKNLNYDNLYTDMFSLDWNRIYDMVDVDDQVRYLKCLICYLYDKNIQLKTKTITTDQNPWFDNQIKSLIDQRNRAYARWKRFKIAEFEQVYKYLRNKVNTTIKYKKIRYYSCKFEKAVGSRQTWKNIKSFGIGQKRSSTLGNEDPNELNVKFVNIPFIAADRDYYSNSNNNVHSVELFNFCRITRFDIAESISYLKSNAIGSDGIDPKFFRIISPYLLPYLEHVFNSILTKSCYPNSWKLAKIIPIPKSGKDYRPIAILPYISKIFERIINTQIRQYLTQHSLLSNFQSGFRSNHSCITALQKVSEDLRYNIDSKKISILILLDHSKAFDCVDHNILCFKLQIFFNFSPQSVKLIKAYLCLRSQSVVIGDLWSRNLDVLRGVPQGSILGPLLYSLYCNDLPLCVKHCSLHMYADDVQLYLSSTKQNFESMVENINIDLTHIEQWAASNGLCLNPTKSKCLIIRDKSCKIPDMVNVNIAGIPIEIVPQAKNLGVIFNSRLTWREHIVSAVGKTNAALRNIFPSQRYTPVRVRILLAKSFLVPKLTYGCELFSSCSGEMLRKLNVAFNNIIRYVFVLDKRDHVSEHAKLLFGVSFENLMKIRTLTSLHKIITSKKPIYLYNSIKFGASPRGRQIIQIKHNKHLSDKFFFINAIRLWNLLPSVIQTITNDRQFKSELFKHYS